jgi:AAA+ superfamily predicted ATPase
MALNASSGIEDSPQLAGDEYPFPYADSPAELADNLGRVHLLLRRAVQRFRVSRSPAGRAGLDGVAVFESEIDEFLKTPPWHLHHSGCDSTAMADGLPLIVARDRVRCEMRARADAGSRRILSLDAIRRRFRLSGMELDICLLCLAYELYPGYGRLYAYLHNDITRPRPSVGLLLDVLADTWATRLDLHRVLARDSRLFRQGPLVDAGGEGLGREILLDPVVVEFLLGGASTPNVDLSQAATLDELVLDEQELRLLTKLGEMLRQPDRLQSVPTVILLSGPDGVGRQTAAGALCLQAGYRLCVFAQTVSEPADIVRVRPWLRGVHAAGAVPAVYVAPKAVELREVLSELGQAVTNGGCRLAFLFVDVDVRPAPGWDDEFRSIAIELSPPSAALRRKTWRTVMAELGLDYAEDELERIVAIYPFTVGTIRRAAHNAADRVRVREPCASRVDFAAMAEACRSRARHRLDHLAQRLVTPYEWSDIILPPDELQRLREVAGAVRNRELVLERWGFAEKASLGPGVSVLFFGPSGTGKTMAASILANDLGMEIYRVDLARVVSKYIGETEKNLDALFEEARRASALLFFDEAEALFGKRSEVKDAHDRYSNIEVSYLLQRMESFEGIAILATNLRNNMDSAFVRRLQFAVEFPLPTYEQRLRIWRQVWPSAADVATDLDLEFMAANFEVAGGHIRNVAVTAAYLAAQERARISMVHLVVATRREFQKFGRLCVAEQFGKYAHLLNGAGRA